MDSKFNIKSLNLETYIYFNNKYDSSTYLESEKTILSGDSNLNIFPNENNTNLNNNYQNVCNYIYEFIKRTNFLCKGLNPEYIKQSFKISDAVIVIGEKGRELLPNGTIFAFAILQFKEQTNSLYIDVICSHSGIKYAGEILIKEVENISKMLIYTSITLQSVTSAISFYEKYGFIKSKKCNNSDLCYMKKNIVNEKLGGKRKKNTKKRKIYKRKTRKY